MKDDVNIFRDNNVKFSENNLYYPTLCDIVLSSFPQEEAVMNRRAIENLSTEILLRYYDNDVSMFLEYLDDHVLWYGPAERQFLRGKDAMVAAWASENNPLTFTIGNLKTELISPGPSLCIVIMLFYVVTHYPSGNDLMLNQRIALTWYERTVTDGQGRRSGQPRILLCDITNPHPQSMDDRIYPVHSEHVFTGFTTAPSTGERLHFHGYGNTEYYLLSSSVMWGDSCANGQRCLLHLTDGTTAEITMSVRDVVAAHPKLFLRCHSSHFINPKFVKSLRRFTVTMTDGSELPIPEKTYTAFKRDLNAFA